MAAKDREQCVCGSVRAFVTDGSAPPFRGHFEPPPVREFPWACWPTKGHEDARGARTINAQKVEGDAAAGYYQRSLEELELAGKGCPASTSVSSEGLLGWGVVVVLSPPSRSRRSAGSGCSAGCAPIKHSTGPIARDMDASGRDPDGGGTILIKRKRCFTKPSRPTAIRPTPGRDWRAPAFSNRTSRPRPSLRVATMN